MKIQIGLLLKRNGGTSMIWILFGQLSTDIPEKHTFFCIWDKIFQYYSHLKSWIFRIFQYYYYLKLKLENNSWLQMDVLRFVLKGCFTKWFSLKSRFFCNICTLVPFAEKYVWVHRVLIIISNQPKRFSGLPITLP